MIYLITGSPGAGKTANALNSLLHDKQFQNRDVYFHDVDSLDVTLCQSLQGGKWTMLSEEDVSNWQQLPPDSVVFIDEAHRRMPARQARNTCPQWIVDLDSHRHDGLDFVLVTQHPKKLDVEVRRLVGSHSHYKRRKTSTFRYDCDQVIDTPEEPNSFKGKDVDKVRVQLPKFVIKGDLYHSATTHTHSYKLSPKLKKAFYGIGFIVVLLGVAGNHLYNRANDIFLEETVSSDSVTEFIPQVADALTSSVIPSSPIPRDSGPDFVPRDQRDYLSAPAYDELNVVRRLPTANCIATVDTCSCYSQDATRIPQVSDAQCRQILHNGQFQYWAEPDRHQPVASNDN